MSHGFLPEEWTQEQCVEYAAKVRLASWTHGIPPREAGRLSEKDLPVIEDDPEPQPASIDLQEVLGELLTALQAAEDLQAVKLAVADALLHLADPTRPIEAMKADLAQRKQVKSEAEAMERQ